MATARMCRLPALLIPCSRLPSPLWYGVGVSPAAAPTSLRPDDTGPVLPQTVRLHMHQNIGKLRQPLSNVKAHVGSDIMPFGDLDPRIHFHMKFDVVL